MEDPQWCHEEMRLSVHPASILSTQKLQTNQFRENFQEKFLEVCRRLQ